MSELHTITVYTIIDPQRLREADRGPLPSRPLSEKRRWTAGLRELEKARAAGRNLAVVFADARDTSKLVFTALLHDIEIHGSSTSFTFTQLQPLHGRTKTRLRLDSKDAFLSAGFIRPYALVRTPRFLHRLPGPTPRRRQHEGAEEAPRAFLLHVNSRSGFSYEKGFDPEDPLACAWFLLRSGREHRWSAGNCWRMMRKNDLLLFKVNGGRKKESAGVYFVGRVSRLPYMAGDYRKLGYVVDAPLTERLMTSPLPAHRLEEFVPKSWGASIQALKGNWGSLFEPSTRPASPVKPAPERLQLVDRSVTVSRRLARDQLFARSVRLRADHRCAVCPPKFNYRDADILEVAHIRPVSARGPDHHRNALVLCPTHHALFDEGLWWLSDDGTVLRSRKLAPFLAAQLAERIPQDWEVDPACVRWHRSWVCK